MLQEQDQRWDGKNIHLLGLQSLGRPEFIRVFQISARRMGFPEPQIELVDDQDGDAAGTMDDMEHLKARTAKLITALQQIPLAQANDLLVALPADDVIFQQSLDQFKVHYQSITASQTAPTVVMTESCIIGRVRDVQRLLSATEDSEGQDSPSLNVCSDSEHTLGAAIESLHEFEQDWVWDEKQHLFLNESVPESAAPVFLRIPHFLHLRRGDGLAAYRSAVSLLLEQTFKLIPGIQMKGRPRPSPLASPFSAVSGSSESRRKEKQRKGLNLQERKLVQGTTTPSTKSVPVSSSSRRRIKKGSGRDAMAAAPVPRARPKTAKKKSPRSSDTSRRRQRKQAQVRQRWTGRVSSAAASIAGGGCSTCSGAASPPGPRASAWSRLGGVMRQGAM